VRFLFWLIPALAAVLAAQNVSYTYDAAGRLTGVTYPSGKVLTYTYDASGNVTQRSVMDPSSTPAPTITAEAIVNAAGRSSGPVAPGELIVIAGGGLGPTTPARNSADRRGVLGTAAGQTSVLFDGVPAPVVYAAASEVSVVVPDSVAGKATTHVVVWHRGKSSAAVELPVAAAAPGLFPDSVRNADGSANGTDHPAVPGSLVSLRGTGRGKGPALWEVTVAGGKVEAEVANRGAGVFEIRFRIPDGTPPGAAPVRVTMGGISSQPGIQVAVK